MTDHAKLCGACEHQLDRHEGYPATTTVADWHSSLPETPCMDCGCTWAEADEPDDDRAQGEADGCHPMLTGIDQHQFSAAEKILHGR